MGNSHHHLAIFRHLMEHGGACIQHDNRLLGFYAVLHVRERATAVAEAELGRALRPGELDGWLKDEARLEATFLGELAAAADPLIFHSRVTQRIAAERFAIAPAHLPFCVYRDAADALDPAARAAARNRLGFAADEIVISTFGLVDRTKAPRDCVWALEMLLGWGYSARLCFVGDYRGRVDGARELAAELGIEHAVRTLDRQVPETEYREYLRASDLGIQLRTHLLGGLSGGLIDCVAAARARATVFISRGEGFGIPPLESLHAGIPVIVDASVPSLEMLPAGGRIDLEESSPDALLRAISRFMDDAQAARLWAEAAAVRVPTWADFANAAGAYVQDRLG